MRRIFIGHRGAGKSSLLKRHLNYFPDVQHYDLDTEIEAYTRKKISDIFSQEGEKKFRQHELEVFSEILQNDEFVIAVGGGFDPLNIPEDIEVIFVSRRTDSDGRIFLNRPKINSNLSDLEDSLKLYADRQERFVERADFIYHMPEGITLSDQIEQTVLSAEQFNLNAYCTLIENNKFELKHHQIELRTDVFTNDEIIKIIRENPHHKIMISYRSKNPTIRINHSNIICDWALELGLPTEQFSIISNHEGTVFEGIEKLKIYSQSHLKLCPVINTWDELVIGYLWQQEAPDQRSFLPRTSLGKSKWRWYRILAASFQKINFVENFVENDDQPSIYELLNFANLKTFGAVIGNPIHHSRSVIEQNVLAIPLSESDFVQAMPFLTDLGLRFASVTSPLKSAAGQLSQSHSDCNSIVYKNGKWIGTSTDPFGFKKLADQIPAEYNQSIAVWGGSGVLSALEKEIAGLNCYSARTGEIKSGQAINHPQVLIWAAPRHGDVQFPWQIYPEWAPKIVLDLNYTENSMGLECAKHYVSDYISGLEMFLEQAKYQRKFWKDNI